MKLLHCTVEFCNLNVLCFEVLVGFIYQKTADPTKLHSENKEPKENKTVDSSSLIRFDANPVSPTKAEVPAQQTASSTPSPAAEKVSNAPNMNSFEFLLFELSAPMALPVGSTTQVPTTTSADALLGAPMGLLESSEATDARPTTSVPKVSNVVGPPPPSTMEKDQAFPNNRTNSTVEETDVQKLPNEQQNPPASPKIIHSNTLQSPSFETLDNQVIFIQNLQNQFISSKTIFLLKSILCKLRR